MVRGAVCSEPENLPLAVRVFPDGTMKEWCAFSPPSHEERSEGRDICAGGGEVPSGFLMTEAAHEFSGSENVALHGAGQGGFGDRLWNLDQRIERIEGKEVTMDRSRWRARPGVPNAARIVDSLAGTVGEFGVGGEALRQAACRRGQVVENPVNKGASGRVRVAEDEGEAARAVRAMVPLKRGRKVLAIAGIQRWNGGAGLEGRAGEMQIGSGARLRLRVEKRGERKSGAKNEQAGNKETAMYGSTSNLSRCARNWQRTGQEIAGNPPETSYNATGRKGAGVSGSRAGAGQVEPPENGGHGSNSAR